MLRCFAGVSLLGAAACGSAPKPTEARILPYDPAQRGKFVEICFSRRVERDDRYQYEMDVVTKEDRTLTCHGSLSLGLADEPSSCMRFNIFAACLDPNIRREDPQEAVTAREYVRPGNVRRVAMRIYSSGSLESATVLEPK